MDAIDQLRAGITLLSFVFFMGLVVWAWSRRNRDGFAEAAQLPFVAEAEDNQS